MTFSPGNIGQEGNNQKKNLILTNNRQTTPPRSACPAARKWQQFSKSSDLFIFPNVHTVQKHYYFSIIIPFSPNTNISTFSKNVSKSAHSAHRHQSLTGNTGWEGKLSSNQQPARLKDELRKWAPSSQLPKIFPVSKMSHCLKISLFADVLVATNRPTLFTNWTNSCLLLGILGDNKMLVSPENSSF